MIKKSEIVVEFTSNKIYNLVRILCFFEYSKRPYVVSDPTDSKCHNFSWVKYGKKKYGICIMISILRSQIDSIKQICTL